MLNSDILFFFDGKPHALELYILLEERICAELPDVTVKVQKSMITFANRYGFAFASHPKRKAEGYGKDYLIVSFGLEHSMGSPRSPIPTAGRTTRQCLSRGRLTVS